MKYYWVLVGVALLVWAGCGDDDQTEGDFYTPCAAEEDCHKNLDGEWLRCIQTPYGGEPGGMCTLNCQASSDDPEENPIVSGVCYPSDDGRCWLGCCFINTGWGSGGNGLCMPWNY